MDFEAVLKIIVEAVVGVREQTQHDYALVNDN